MTGLLKYLLHRPTWQKLPMIPRQYAVGYDPFSVDDDTAMLMRLTQVRSPQAVKLLMKKHHAASARELIETLPARRRPWRLRARALALARRAFGLTSYDPLRRIARQHRRRGRR